MQAFPVVTASGGAIQEIDHPRVASRSKTTESGKLVNFHAALGDVRVAKSITAMPTTGAPLAGDWRRHRRPLSAIA
ncbi:hypothetical protein IP88_12610 [alpha proteobacterium AAP81b]|nr:hypothetical protein IP88_12610 [alpha proteobacterium AAP81b]